MGCAGTYANLVKQAKSKQKILDKMEAAGLTPPVARRRTFQVSHTTRHHNAPSSALAVRVLRGQICRLAESQVPTDASAVPP